jgi:hypothetical protein
MRVRRLSLLCAALLFSVNSWAQDSSRVEIFGGYTYTSYPIFQIYSGPWARTGFNGWDASATFKLAPHVGLEGDFSGGYTSYGSNSYSYNLRTYTAGPRVSANFGKVDLYGHVLLGGLTFHSQSGGTTGTSFAAVLGGGVDWWLKPHFGVRPVQFDYLVNTNAAAQGGNNAPGQPRSSYRIVTGVVFRFGR